MDAIQKFDGTMICGLFVLGPVVIAIILGTAVAAYNRSTKHNARKAQVPELLFGQAIVIGLLAVLAFVATNWVLLALFDQGQLEPDDNSAAMRSMALAAGAVLAILCIVAALENILKVGFDKVFTILLYCIPVAIIISIAVGIVVVIATLFFVPRVE